jgi:cytochrome P460
MHKTTKMLVLACFAVTAAYFAFWSFAGQHLVSASAGENSATGEDEKVCQCPDAKESSLPLPGSLAPDEFHHRLLAFLENGEYAKLKWCEDKRVRDTGPWIDGKYYGVHPAVKVHYSPAVIDWLVSGRLGAIPDGAMIVKEMYNPGPAARWQDQQLKPESWTVMIKDSKGSKDGWFWGEFWTGNPPMPKPSANYKPPFSVPSEGYGLACIHCHASAEKELTFASLKNIKGFPGDPITYFVDNTWRTPPKSAPSPEEAENIDPSHRKSSIPLTPLSAPKSVPTQAAEFAKLFGSLPADGAVRSMPAETYDHIVAGPRGAEKFITSDNCQWCHSGNAWYGKKDYMILQTAKGEVNVSPYGEWRWSPMGLAGRDPIFYAQLDSEIAYLKRDKTEKDVQTVVNLCFSCHGVMGKRQLNLDHNYDGQTGNQNSDKEPDFKLDFVYNTDLNNPNFKYGALARDGVSCAACHHIVEDKTPAGKDSLKHFLENSTTGRFQAGKADELYGPFKDKEITPYPMKESLGVDPKHNQYIKDSRLCGSCHVIDLPVIDGKPDQMHIEQATYLEWLNSQYQTEFSPGPNAKSCQDCHMPAGYANKKNNVNISQIQSVIADVQDESYPMSENRASEEKVRVRYRTGVVAKGEEGFVRHQLQGLNIFLIEMFNQFMQPDAKNNYYNEILGVRKSDYMSTLGNDLETAVANLVQQAENDTATVELSAPKIVDKDIVVDVKVTNKTGHRLPSGVGFRRAFIEFTVIEKSSGKEKIIWASGLTNEYGFIVDNDGNILDSEYVGTSKGNLDSWQHHYWAPDRPITSSKQVQIYEELVKNAKGDFTTSFLRIDEDFKDNRLLPIGWKPAGPSPSLTGRYLKATLPKGEAADDPNYKNGNGTSIVRYKVPISELRGASPSKLTVKAALYHQSIPPYYLMQRFEQAPTGDGTRRLYYLTSNLRVKGTPIENWKLYIASSSAPVVR